MKILYHGWCADGYGAAWAFQRFWTINGNDFIPVNYNQPIPPGLEGQEVYLLDFCYKFQELLEIAKVAKKLVIIDHHATAEVEIDQLLHTTMKRCPVEKVFNIQKSGAVMVWEYFYPREKIPTLLLYVQDRDLWKWQMPQSREFNDALSSYEFDFSTWTKLAERDAYSLIFEGQAIGRYKKKIIDQAVKNAIEIDFHGYKVLSTNTTTLISEIGEQLCQGRPFSATYFIRDDGMKIWSLRSAEDGLDVSVLAKQLGGGGHKHAAGFRE